VHDIVSNFPRFVLEDHHHRSFCRDFNVLKLADTRGLVLAIELSGQKTEGRVGQAKLWI
jgi:hypothetical protein